MKTTLRISLLSLIFWLACTKQAPNPLEPTGSLKGDSFNQMSLPKLSQSSDSPSAYITTITFPNTPDHEWAATMTADIFPDEFYAMSVRWFVKAQFSWYQWIEYTSEAFGPNNEYLTVEQLYGYCFDVYCIIDVYRDGDGGIYGWWSPGFTPLTSQVYRICSVGEP